MFNLRDHLFRELGGFADLRCKDPSQDHPFKIDDRSPHDAYPYFCIISARVSQSNPETLILTLQYAPCSDEIMALVEKLSGVLHPSLNGPTITLIISKNHVSTIAKLSQAIRRMVSKKRTFRNPNLKWICPRTADSLDRLVEILATCQV